MMSSGGYAAGRRLGGGGAVALLAAAWLAAGSAWPGGRVRAPGRPPTDVTVLEVTGYCKCGACCGWTRNWLLRPVIQSGPNRGKPKQVGVTASGVRARPGTIAADTDLYPFGTVMHVPGYGYGIVEDRGSAIKGRAIDLYFTSHRAAERWGRQKLRVRVWKSAR